MGLEMLKDLHPALKITGPLLQAIVAPMFGEDEKADPVEEVKEKLDELTNQLKTDVQNMKDHTENVVMLAELGGESGTLSKTMKVLKTHIDDIMDDTSKTQAEKINDLAGLRRNQVVTNVETAVSGATDAFRGNTSYTLGNVSIFDAAYRRACEDVMFSREAIDATVPYITQQLGSYLAAYAMLEQVYDAYEAVKGAGSQSYRKASETSYLSFSYAYLQLINANRQGAEDATVEFWNDVTSTPWKRGTAGKYPNCTVMLFQKG